MLRFLYFSSPTVYLLLVLLSFGISCSSSATDEGTDSEEQQIQASSSDLNRQTVSSLESHWKDIQLFVQNPDNPLPFESRVTGENLSELFAIQQVSQAVNNASPQQLWYNEWQGESVVTLICPPLGPESTKTYVFHFKIEEEKYVLVGLEKHG
jgi:hypothetical protein